MFPISNLRSDDDDVYYIGDITGERLKLEGGTDDGRLNEEAERRDQALLEVRYSFLAGSGRPSVLMLIRSAPALATMRPVLLLTVLKTAARRYCNRDVWGCTCSSSKISKKRVVSRCACRNRVAKLMFLVGEHHDAFRF